MVCIYFHRSVARGSASHRGSVSNCQGIYLIFRKSSPHLKMSAGSEKKRKYRCLCFSLVFRLDFFFLPFFYLNSKKKPMQGGAYRRDSERRRGPWVTWWLWVGRDGGSGRGVKGGLLLPFSLVVVAVLQVFTLNVPAAVVCAGELDAVLVHAPADASFAAARWLALWVKKQRCSFG